MCHRPGVASRGEALLAWIEANNTSRRAIARAAHIDKGTVGLYVRDKSVGSLPHWRKLARVLHVTAEGLMAGIMPGDACPYDPSVRRPVEPARTDAVGLEESLATTTLAAEAAKLAYSDLELNIHTAVRVIATHPKGGEPVLFQIRKYVNDIVDDLAGTSLPKSHLRSGGDRGE